MKSSFRRSFRRRRPCALRPFSPAERRRQHGIKRYERPVLSCDTIFDALARAGKKVAIVAVRDSSIDLIFRERPIDYFSPTYDAARRYEAFKRKLSERLWIDGD